MSSYLSLAPFYDALTGDVDYSAFVNFYEKVFKKEGVQVQTVLDLGCGTCTLTEEMAKRGYEMIGVDASDEMLMVASEKFTSGDYKFKPLLLNQSMEELDLYGTVDAAVSCLDSLDYVEQERLPEVFRRLMLFIRPGGMLVFDVNTPEKLRDLDGEVFIDETDDVYCVWRAEFDEEENAIFYGMDIFSRNGDKWERDFEEHIEYAHTAEMLVSLLESAGFENVKVYGELSFEAPRDGEQRIFITAVRP